MSAKITIPLFPQRNFRPRKVERLVQLLLFIETNFDGWLVDGCVERWIVGQIRKRWNVSGKRLHSFGAPSMAISGLIKPATPTLKLFQETIGLVFIWVVCRVVPNLWRLTLRSRYLAWGPGTWSIDGTVCLNVLGRAAYGYGLGLWFLRSLRREETKTKKCTWNRRHDGCSLICNDEKITEAHVIQMPGYHINPSHSNMVEHFTTRDFGTNPSFYLVLEEGSYPPFLVGAAETWDGRNFQMWASLNFLPHYIKWVSFAPNVGPLANGPTTIEVWFLCPDRGI